MSKRLLVVGWAVVGALLAWPTMNAEAAGALSNAQFRGAPKIEAGKQLGFFVWTDAKGVHVRWSSDGNPVLFTGSFEVDRKLPPLVRANPQGSGWVEPVGDTILFSSTVLTAVDGFDVPVPAGASVKIDLQMDGKPVDPNIVSAGAELAHPVKVPLRFSSSP